MYPTSGTLALDDQAQHAVGPRKDKKTQKKNFLVSHVSGRTLKKNCR